MVSRNGKCEKSGAGSNRDVNEFLDTVFRYFTSNLKSISNSISIKIKNFLMHISDMQGLGLTPELGIAELIRIYLGALEKPVQEVLLY